MKRFWTHDPFMAMSVAAKMGRKVARYPSGQYIPGMFSLPMEHGLDYRRVGTFYGYGVLDPAGGFTWIDWSTV